MGHALRSSKTRLRTRPRALQCAAVQPRASTAARADGLTKLRPASGLRQPHASPMQMVRRRSTITERPHRERGRGRRGGGVIAWPPVAASHRSAQCPFSRRSAPGARAVLSCAGPATYSPGPTDAPSSPFCLSWAWALARRACPARPRTALRRASCSGAARTAGPRPRRRGIVRSAP